jgi:polynucleotide 5'-kinase involved in rRNA processing
MPPASSITPASGWSDLLARLDRGTILVAGAPGTGKTALSHWLLSQLGRGRARAALVDCDLGRPSVGAPGCLGLALTAPWRAPEALWFVGGTAPEEHPLPVVVGAARLADRARAAGAAFVVVDTSGLVDGPAGRALKVHKALAAGVDPVVALQRGGELDALLDLLAAPGRTLHRLAASPLARPVSDGERSAQRDGRFRAHLAGARTRLFAPRRFVGSDWTVGLAGGAAAAAGDGHGGDATAGEGRDAAGAPAALSPDPGPDPAPPEGEAATTARVCGRAHRVNGRGSGVSAPGAGGPALAPGTVVGLLDERGLCLGLGRVEAVHADRVEVATAVAAPAVARLQAGVFRLAEDGSAIADGPQGP